MEILYLLVPLAIVLAALIVAGLLWAIRSGQFDDLERPAHEIFWDTPVANSAAPAVIADVKPEPPTRPIPVSTVPFERGGCSNACTVCDRRRRDETNRP